MTIEVLKPGALSTFQDLGRIGHQHNGIPVSGVMDERSHRLACMLVGNAPSQATLEVTLLGPTLKFEAPAVIAVCGADLSATLGGNTLPLGTQVSVAAGDLLSFGKRASGLRAYIAVAGGYALQPVMGSTSTYVRGGFGGAQGRPLQKGDRIALGPAATGTPSVDANGFMFPKEVQRPSGTPLRIVPGREWQAFEPCAHRAMAEQAFRVSPRSDRMGYRLEGEPLRLLQALELQSEAVSFGTVQVPPDGFPIVLMADRQTTGGYPRIANVATVDLPRLAQVMAGDELRFEWITLDAAQKLAVVQGEIFRMMEAGRGVH
ncbi:biotin-dependent carboxyltransferase family protein [Variovorax sp. E3]|uniref:5-oxoprolinase subunit C family protein n=1 Tax=Variovorax sp. E3 TaxID=1914993 RepID=UPI0018DCDA0D|nr:biotin-dependent carboxyltransferase family protein [Variovorax sp. E3]